MFTRNWSATVMVVVDSKTFERRPGGWDEHEEGKEDNRVGEEETKQVCVRRPENSFVPRPTTNLSCLCVTGSPTSGQQNDWFLFFVSVDIIKTLYFCADAQLEQRSFRKVLNIFSKNKECKWAARAWSLFFRHQARIIP